MLQVRSHVAQHFIVSGVLRCPVEVKDSHHFLGESREDSEAKPVRRRP